MTKPTCWCCGKPIAKKVQTLYFGMSSDKGEDRTAKPKTRAEAQLHNNFQLVSVRYAGRLDNDYVMRASYWDGESYISEFFCKESCAAEFGKDAARSIKERRLVRN